jgi:hypothetical protein
MNVLSFLRKMWGQESAAQDSHLPLKVTLKSTITLDINPILSAITHGAMINISLDNLKFLKVKAISSIVLAGMDTQKIYRFYFEYNEDNRLFLQVLCNKNNVSVIDDILLCASTTEPLSTEEDIAFFRGDNDVGLGEKHYRFSQQDLTSFLSENEVEKRLHATDDKNSVEYERIEPAENFIPAFNGVETVIFDSLGEKGEQHQILNFMPHSRSLQGSVFEKLIVAFWVTTSQNGAEIPVDNQLPLADYIFAIKLESTNINVI